MRKKLKMWFDKDLDHVEAIIDSLKPKRSEKIKTEEPQETTAEKAPLKCDKKEEIDDILTMTLLEDEKEEVKEGKGLEILTPNKLFTRLPVLSFISLIISINESWK